MIAGLSVGWLDSGLVSVRKEDVDMIISRRQHRRLGGCCSWTMQHTLHVWLGMMAAGGQMLVRACDYSACAVLSFLVRRGVLLLAPAWSHNDLHAARRIHSHQHQHSHCLKQA